MTRQVGIELGKVTSMTKIVGVTSCPTGIAHTYMSAEKLTKAAEAQGFEAKFETQGVKVDNELTNADIKSADAIILAIDRSIDKSRFAGLRVKEVATKRAIKEPEKVIEEALAGEGVTKVTEGSAFVDEGGKKVTLYNHFMNGVNMMLPFVIAGGILIAASFAFGIKAATPGDPTYNPIAYVLNNIGGNAAFYLMVPALAAGIAQSIAGKQGLAVGMVMGLLAKLGGSGFLGGMVGGIMAGYFTRFMVENLGNKVPKSVSAIYQLIVVPLVSMLVVGVVFSFCIDAPVAWVLNALTDWLNGLGSTSGLLFGLLIGIMMAADMGGPINKAISTFSIGLMSAGVNAPIAACMVAGMTPPLGLALATILFKNKFTEEERTNGKSCWVLGASYITEGAIPFAVADPLRVIPSCMVGSAAAAAISLGFGVTSMAPHGGIWVILIPNVISNPLVYFAAIVVGAVLTCLCVGLLKKPVAAKA